MDNEIVIDPLKSLRNFKGMRTPRYLSFLYNYYHSN